MTGESFNLENSGMGDSQVITRYEILNQMKGAPLFLAVGAGMKLPTGSTNNSFSTPMGERQPKQTQPMQLGSGSYDYIAEIGASKIIPNSRIDAHLIYFLTTEGKNDYKFGDKLKWNLGYSYAITKYFNIQLELDGMHLAKNELEGNSVDSSGGNFIYLTPGIHIVPSKKFDLSLGYMHMVHRDNNYNSIDMVGGLSEDYRVIARLGYNF
ncbi:MAG: transporter [Sulfurospirillum sp.]|nr:transporter [Sulfurospirillum sp.]